MAKRHRAAILLVVLGLAVLALMLAAPAVADSELCPKSWAANPNIYGSDRERNTNTFVCSKDVNGKGSNGDGHNVKDDGPH